MRKRLHGYLKKTDALLCDAPPETDWNSVLSDHLRQITFFQHERMIHLLVTLFFGFMTMAWFVIFYFAALKPFLVLAVLCTVLDLAYIYHYYCLENGVQKMYEQYDRLLENTGNYCFPN